MRIVAISQPQCSELLKRLYIGRLGCTLDNQPYIVPVHFSYKPDSIYIFSTLGKKIEWMRQNPKVCLQADEIVDGREWLSVIVTGTYLELTGPQYEDERRAGACNDSRSILDGGESPWRQGASKPAICRLRMCSFASTLSR